MTTIACDGRMIAADGLVTGNGTIHATNHQKIARLADGRVVGFAGNCYHQQEAMEFLNGSRDKIDLGEAFEAIILHPDGRCITMDGSGRFVVQSVPAVTGSGGPYALSAMLCGQDAFEAVKTATRLDTTSGGTSTFMVPGL